MDATLSGCTYATCPYCGREDKDSWELEDEGVIECQCGKSFGFDRVVEVTYTMQKNDGER